MIGLDKIIKYGYGYMGYLGIAIIIIPFLTIGAYKNRKYLKSIEGKAPSNSKLAEEAEF